MTPGNQIEFDRAKLENFKRAYEKARYDNRDTFTFEGNQFVVRYAYYVIQYLETKLPKGG